MGSIRFQLLIAGLVVSGLSHLADAAEGTVISRFIKKCSESREWSVTLVTQSSDAASGAKEYQSRCSFRGPGQLRAQSQGDDKPLVVVNRARGWIYDAKAKECTDIKEADAVKMLGRLSLALPLVAVPDKMGAFTSDTRSEPVEELFDGVKCVRFELEAAKGRLRLWLEDHDDGPLLRGAEWKPSSLLDGASGSRREVYRDWSFQPPAPESFTFEPPPGCYVIDALTRRRTQKPLPIKVPAADGKLARDFIARQQAWMERHLVERFAARHQSAPWLAEAKAFLHQAVPFFCVHATRNDVTGASVRPSPDLKQTGLSLIARGCDDAVICLATAVLESFKRNASKNDADLLFSKLKPLIDGDDTHLVKALAVAWLWYSSYAGEAEARSRKVWDACEQLLPDLITAAVEEASSPEDSLCFAQTFFGGVMHVYTKWKPERMRELLTPGKGAGWLVGTVLGDLEVEEAWKARGSGWASTVTEEGWKGFADHLAVARKHLLRAWEDRKDVPWAATSMITVTMAGHGIPGTDERQWFDRATAAVFDHAEAYYAMFGALQPRWGGSHEEMLDFAKACADTKRYDTLVPSRLFYAVKEVAEELACMDEVHGDAELDRRIVELQQAMLDHAKSASDRHYLRSFLVANALLAHDYDTAARAWSELEAPIHEAAVARLGFFGKPSILWQGMLALHGEPEAFQHFLQAESLYRAQDLAKARKAYQLARQSGGSKAAKPGPQLLSMRLAAIAVEERLAKGGWVKLQPEELRHLWLPQTGAWWNHPDGSLSFKNEREDAAGRVILNARIGLEFEVRGRLAVPEELDHPQLGVVFAFQWDHNGYASAVAGVTRRKPSAYGATLVPLAYDSSDLRPNMPARLKSDSTFRFRLQKGIATLWIDEQQVFAKDAQDLFKNRDPWREASPENNLFGFGANHFPKGEPYIKDIEFQRLEK